MITVSAFLNNKSGAELQDDFCIFCAIVDGSARSYSVWQSDSHMAFLSIYPNTRGVTVVIPKKHYDSDAFSMSDEDLSQLVCAAKETSKILLRIPGVGRVAMALEGFGVNHVHAKLYPLHGTDLKEWKEIPSKVNNYFETYQGYITTNDGPLADDKDLAELSNFLTKHRE